MKRVCAAVLIFVLSACGDDDPNRIRFRPDASPADSAVDAAVHDAAPIPPKPDAAPPVPAWPNGVYDLKFEYTGTCPQGANLDPHWDRMRVYMSSSDTPVSLTFWQLGQREIHGSGIYDAAQDILRVEQALVSDGECAVIAKPWAALHTIRGLAGQFGMSFVGNCFTGEICHPGTFMSWTITGARGAQ